ncbi:MAG TPA: YfhO family protein [Blastocatellia bacterium]|nr:YfhO family protein [Blastocatellia bacterium]
MQPETEVELAAIIGNPRTLDPSPRTRDPFIRHAVNVTFILVAIIALFWRVFFLGETLIDVNTLNNQLPWGYSAGQSGYQYNRRDLTDTYVTREYFVVSAYRDGEIPLWNPYTMAGHPIYADGVTRTLSPFLLFYRFFDVPLGYSLARLVELMLAAILMYIFLVAIGASANGALMGSLVFGFSAHSMLHVTGLGWWGGLMWLPLILLFLDRAIRRGSYPAAMVAGVFLAAQFFCGYLPNQIYYVGGVVLYYVFFANVARRSEGGSRAVARLLAMMVVTLAVGLALSATQWVPSVELLSYSNRKIVGAELGYVYLPPWYAATLVFPNLFGAAYDAKMITLFTALGVSHDHILYLGIAALVPLGFVLYWLRQTSKKRNGASRLLFAGVDDAARSCVVFFVMLAGCSLVLMMAAPLYVHITRYIPILQVIRVAVRAGVLFLFAASVLVAFGTDLLLQSGSDAIRRFGRLARRFVFGAAAFVLLAVIASYVIKLVGVTIDAGERGRLAFIRRTALALSGQFSPPNLSILIPLALLFVVAFLVWAFVEKRLTSRSFLLGMAALLVVDLFWNSNQFDHTFDRSRVFPRTEITDILHSLPPGRVLVVPSGLETNRTALAGAGMEKIIAPPNTLLPYQIATASGKNQQFPKWYREYASLIEPQPNLSHVVFDQYRSPFFDVLNVRYVMTHESAPPLDGYDLLANAEGVSLYENKNALPRAFFARNAVAVSSPAESLTRMRAPDFDPRAQTVVEGDLRTPSLLPVESRSPDSETQTPASAAIIADGRNWVVIETDNPLDGLLVLSDNYYPSWSASVDGATTQIFRANHTMRAVNVPAGRHLVSFRFMPAALFVSMYVSLAAAALTLVALILSVFRRRRSNSHDIRQDQNDS